MNRSDRPEPRCDFEDRVAAAFLDGEPDADAGMLAAHLDACDACAEAVRQSRELEALLAAQTRTDIDDATADRLLAGIDAGVADVGVPDVGRTIEPAVTSTAPVRRLHPIRVAAAAAVLLAALTAVWVFTRDRAGESARPDGAPVREAGTSPVREAGTAPARESGTAPAVSPAPAAAEAPSKARAPAVGMVTAPSGFVLPEPGSRERPRAERKPVSDEDVLRRLEGDRGLVLDRRVLTARATAWLTPEEPADDIDAQDSDVQDSDARSGAQMPGAEKPDPLDVRRATAASRWLFGEIRRGWLPADRALLPARRLLASRGPVRRALVATAREYEDVLARLVRRRTYRGRPDGETAALVGAVGCPGLMVAVRKLNAPELAACVAEARHTGDTRCLTFLVDLYLDGAVRRHDIRWSGKEWFRPTLATAGESLAAIIRQRALMGRNRAHIGLGHELLVRLGLAETCLLARAEPSRLPRG